MTRIFATALASSALLALSAAASAQTYYGGDYRTQQYEECERSDTDDQVIGGLLGGALGGVLGNEIGGDTGAVIGGVGGAVAGAKIGDKNCEKRVYGNRDARYRSQTYQPRSTYQPRNEVLGSTIRYDQYGNRIYDQAPAARYDQYGNRIYDTQPVQQRTRYYDARTNSYYYK